MNAEQIREVLNREDIEGLIALGAPEDEYDMEAEMIANAVARHESSLDEMSLAAMVREVWIKSFSPFSEEGLSKRQPAFIRVARRVLGDLNG